MLDPFVVLQIRVKWSVKHGEQFNNLEVCVMWLTFWILVINFGMFDYLPMQCINSMKENNSRKMALIVEKRS